MKNQELRSSLIKSAILLILCIFLIYSFAESDSGGIAGTISSLFSGIVFLIGLTLALVVSVFVMFGIYFGILYMYNQDTFRSTYDEFKNKINDFTKNLCGSCSSARFSSEQTRIHDTGEDLSAIKEDQQKLAEQLTRLKDSLALLENTLTTVSDAVAATSETMASHDEKITDIYEVLNNTVSADAVIEATKPLSSEVNAIENSLKPLTEKVAALESSITSLKKHDADTTNELKNSFDTAISAIKTELSTMNSAIENIATPETESDDDSPHRILSYFDKKSDEEQFVSLVTEAVEKGMTYAQVGDFLNDSLSSEASEIIADHPSLTKDFIRACRQNN